MKTMCMVGVFVCHPVEGHVLVHFGALQLCSATFKTGV